MAGGPPDIPCPAQQVDNEMARYALLFEPGVYGTTTAAPQMTEFLAG